MKATLRKMGNSQGVLIPKALVDLLGITGDLDLTVENGALVLRTPPAAVSQDALDAQRFRKLCVLLQKAYDGETVELDGVLTAYCAMQSGWKGERTVKAELIWHDVRDEPLDLASALDKIVA